MTETAAAAVAWSAPVVTSKPVSPAREGRDEADSGGPPSRAPQPLPSEQQASCWAAARCIAHVDADCFYAQVEELADPALRFRLLAVRQKHLVVACSLNTRAAVGNLKGLSATDALKRCPSLHIANGEDLTKYRRVSDRLLVLLQGQPWRGDSSHEKSWLAKHLEGAPQGPPSGGPPGPSPAVVQGGPRVLNSERQGPGSSSSCCCCCSRTAAARASWSAVSAAVAAEAARPGGMPHSVQRLGLDDFYVDVSAAARVVTGSLLSTLQRVCHAEDEIEACCCSLSVSISQATKQPRSSGTLLPSSAISCRSCSCCMSLPLQSKAAQSTAAAAEPDKRRDTKRVNCCCKWDLQCPAFVYNGSRGDDSRSAERLLQQPLLFAPLLAALRQGGHVASLADTACLSHQPPVTLTQGLNQQQQQQQQEPQQQQQQRQEPQQQQQQQEPQQQKEELSSSSTLPTQELPADDAVEGHEQQQLRRHEQQQQQPYPQQQVKGAAARCCFQGGECVCGAQRLLLVVAAHLTEAMRGLVFSALGGLTTTGGVSINKSLAKLAAKLHKPSQQTLLLREHRRRFLEGKLLRSLPGIGSATARRLAAANINTCSQLLAVSPQRLAEILSSVDPPPPRSSVAARHQHQQEQLRLQWSACAASPVAAAQAERLRLLCLGDEEETVQETACASKTMTVEDSYATRPITSWSFLKTEIKRLVRRLLLRHAEWVERFGLVASSLKVSLRLKGHRERVARSVPLPQPVKCLLKAATQSTSNSSLQSTVGPQGELTSSFSRPKADPAADSCDAVSEGTLHSASSGSDEEPLHLAVFVLSVQLFEKILGCPSSPYDNAWATKGVVVFSLTFHGFEAFAPSRSTSSPGDHAATPSRTHSPIKAFGKRAKAEQQQQQQQFSGHQGTAGRQHLQPGSRGSNAVAPASCSSAPGAFDGRGRGRSLQQSELPVRRNSNERSSVFHSGATAASSAKADACGDSEVLITVSSRESSPDPSSMRGSASSAQGAASNHGSVERAMSALPLSSPAVQSVANGPSQSRLGPTEVVEIDSEDSVEEAADARTSVQQGTDRVKQRNTQQSLSNRKSAERSCLAGDYFNASPAPGGLQEASTTRLQGSKRMGQRRPGDQETAGRAKKRKPQGAKNEGLALTHFFARK
ncbi:hypothetical protein Emed_006657 [Eimeria media]